MGVRSNLTQTPSEQISLSNEQRRLQQTRSNWSHTNDSHSASSTQGVPFGTSAWQMPSLSQNPSSQGSRQHTRFRRLQNPDEQSASLPLHGCPSEMLGMQTPRKPLTLQWPPTHGWSQQ